MNKSSKLGNEPLAAASTVFGVFGVFGALGPTGGAFEVAAKGAQLPQLVIQLARMGDLLQTRRLLVSLQREGPVHLCVDRSLAEFAAFLYPFAQIHAVQAHGGNFEQTEFLASNRIIFKCLQAIPFQAVYNLNYSGLNLALSTLFPSAIMHGHWLEAGQPMRSHWMSLAFRWSAQRRVSPLNLMDFWGLMAPNPIAPQAVNPQASPKGGGLGVVLAGRMARRSIPPGLWGKFINATAQRLIAQANKQAAGSGRTSNMPSIYLLGSSQEQGVAKQVLRELPTAVLANTKNMAGKTNLLQLGELVSGLDLLITPDTGTMHLATFLGVPVEAYFLSSAWCYETGPYGLGHKVWQALQPCLPCLEVRPCPNEVMCLNPFWQKEFLPLLVKANAKAALPQGLLSLHSEFDDLGVTYNLCPPSNLLGLSGVTDGKGGKAEVALDAYLKENERRLILRKIIANFVLSEASPNTQNHQLEQDSQSIESELGECLDLLGINNIASISPISTIQGQMFKESDWMLPR